MNTYVLFSAVYRVRYRVRVSFVIGIFGGASGAYVSETEVATVVNSYGHHFIIKRASII